MTINLATVRHKLVGIILYVWLLCPLIAFGQTAVKSPLNQIITSVNDYTAKMLPEKLYIQTDKPSYALGDTLWFKGYLLDAAYLNASTKSGILYAEIANDSNKVMQRIMLPVYNGLTFGNIALDDIPQGTYTLRAYTNWMRNFGEKYVFSKTFTVTSTAATDWLVNYKASTSKTAWGKENVKLQLQFNQFDKIPVAVREMQFRVMSGKKTLYKSDVLTSVDGSLNTHFDLPEKADPKNLSLSIQDARKGGDKRMIKVPVSLARPQNTDIEFMPEGGNMVAGLPSQVAFKAIDEDGRGINVSGKVLDSKNNEVADFNTLHTGMGSFNLIPEAGESYSAKVKLIDGSFKTFPLPKVVATGVTLKVKNEFPSDSLEVTLSVTPDLINNGSNYYLIATSRGIAVYGASVKFSIRSAKFIIDKKVFPTGIAKFTLLTTDTKPLCERMAFIDHQDRLRFKLTENKSSYRLRDSVGLSLQVTDKNGAPVQGSFSVAVTDDGQVKVDSLKNATIASRLLLTGDLKGGIEDPGYYFPSVITDKVWKDRDLLLLTHGWVGYNWSDIFGPAKATAYQPELEYTISGRVKNVFNKPVANSNVTLFSKKPLMVTDTVTNEKGEFIFKNISVADTAVFFLQSRNKKGKSMNVGIEMDNFVPPVFSASTERTTPWYVNIDTSKYIALSKQNKLRLEEQRAASGNMLKAVVIKDKKIIKGSKNLNGPGKADFIIDEKELEKAGRKTLKELLQERFTAFRLKADSGKWNYVINSALVHIIIDGISTDIFLPEEFPRYEYLDQYLDYLDAEEIKGIEIMYKGGNSMLYTTTYVDPKAVPWDHAFIEVTTRSGHGPFVKKAVGTYVFRPMPVTVPKQFYSPRYPLKNVVNIVDIRSTVHWEPNVITDNDGKATISFFTTDQPGTYTLFIEGTDLNGNIGSKQKAITVKRQVLN